MFDVVLVLSFARRTNVEVGANGAFKACALNRLDSTFGALHVHVYVAARDHTSLHQRVIGRVDTLSLATLAQVEVIANRALVARALNRLDSAVVTVDALVDISGGHGSRGNISSRF